MTEPTLPSAQDALEALGSEPPGNVKACKRILRRGGMHRKADALKHYELVNEVADLLSKEATKPEKERPLIAALKNEKPEAYWLLMEEEVSRHPLENIRNHHPPKLSPRFRELAQDATAQIPPDLVAAAKEAHRLHIKNRHAGINKTPPAPPSAPHNNVSKELGDVAKACAFEEEELTAKAGGDVHYHFHYNGERKALALPEYLASEKGHTALCITATIGALWAGAYLLKEFSKTPGKKEPDEPGKSWQKRAEEQPRPRTPAI